MDDVPEDYLKPEPKPAEEVQVEEPEEETNDDDE